jgi:hypothetical protein
VRINYKLKVADFGKQDLLSNKHWLQSSPSLSFVAINEAEIIEQLVRKRTWRRFEVKASTVRSKRSWSNQDFHNHKWARHALLMSTVDRSTSVNSLQLVIHFYCLPLSTIHLIVLYHCFTFMREVPCSHLFLLFFMCTWFFFIFPMIYQYVENQKYL